MQDSLQQRRELQTELASILAAAVHQGLLSEQEAICDMLIRINLADAVHYTRAPPRFPGTDSQWCRVVAEAYLQPGVHLVPALNPEQVKIHLVRLCFCRAYLTCLI